MCLVHNHSDLSQGIRCQAGTWSLRQVLAGIELIDNHKSTQTAHSEGIEIKETLSIQQKILITLSCRQNKLNSRMLLEIIIHQIYYQLVNLRVPFHLYNKH